MVISNFILKKKKYWKDCTVNEGRLVIIFFINRSTEPQK